MLKLIEQGKLGQLFDYLVFEIEKMISGDIDFCVIASNTPHIVYMQVITYWYQVCNE